MPQVAAARSSGCLQRRRNPTDGGRLLSPVWTSEITETDDFLAQLDAEPLAHDRPAVVNQLADIARRGRPVVDDEIAVRWRYARAADRKALETGAIDQRSRRPRNPIGDDVPPRLGILENASGARRVER